MTEETEEEFKARMAAISAGYKKGSADKKKQLAAEGRALVREPLKGEEPIRTKDDDPHYGRGLVTRPEVDYCRIPGGVDPEMIRERFRDMASRFRDMHFEEITRAEEAINRDFLLMVADCLNYHDPAFPNENLLRKAISYGLGEKGRDTIVLVEEPYDHISMVSWREGIPPLLPEIRVSLKSMKDSISRLERRHPGFQRLMEYLSGQFRRGAPKSYVLEELERHFHRHRESYHSEYADIRKSLVVSRDAFIIDELRHEVKMRTFKKSFGVDEVQHESKMKTFKEDRKKPWERYVGRKKTPHTPKPVTGK